MTWLIRFVNSNIVRYAVFGLAVWLGGNWLSNTIERAASVELVQSELAAAKYAHEQDLLSNEQKIERLESDLAKANVLRIQYRKDAQIENSKLKKLLTEKTDVKDWHDSPLPDDIKRLRNERTVHHQ